MVQCKTKTGIDRLPTVEFVHWKNRSTLIGQVMNTKLVNRGEPDETEFLKYTFFTGPGEYQTLDDVVFIQPDTGIPWKFQHFGAHAIPEDLRTLRTMWSTALSNLGKGDNRTAQNPGSAMCCRCGEFGDPDQEADMKRCGLCLQTYHAVCAQRVISVATERVPSRKFKRTQLPKLFTTPGVCCKICRELRTGAIVVG